MKLNMLSEKKGGGKEKIKRMNYERNKHETFLCLHIN